MFSGIAPYPIVISRNTCAKEIYGIEINLFAHKFAEENILLNKIKNVKDFLDSDVKKQVRNDRDIKSELLKLKFA